MVMRREFFFLWETAKLVQLLRLKREHMLISIGVHNEVKDYPKVKISLRMNRSEKKEAIFVISHFSTTHSTKNGLGVVYQCSQRNNNEQEHHQKVLILKQLYSKDCCTVGKKCLHWNSILSLDIYFFFKNCTNRCPKLDCWFYGPLEIRVETKLTNVLNIQM